MAPGCLPGRFTTPPPEGFIWHSMKLPTRHRHSGNLRAISGVGKDGRRSRNFESQRAARTARRTCTALPFPEFVPARSPRTV